MRKFTLKEIVTFIFGMIGGLFLAAALLAFWMGLGLFVYCCVT